MEYSTYQKAFFKEIAGSQRNLILEAVAGSGKSFTIKESLNYLPDSMNALFCCFNVPIAAELKKKITRPRTTVSTINALGWGICRENIKCELNRFKTGELLKGYFDFDDPTMKGLYFKSRGPISRIISLLKAELCGENLDASMVYSLISKHDIKTPEKLDLDYILPRIWKDSLACTAVLDFDDQVFMPLYLGLPLPEFEIGFVDEAQDLNKARRELVGRVSKRLVAVGDERQAINAFCGADANSMKNIREQYDCVPLDLSICYRCPRTGVAEAAKINPKIEPKPGAIEGIFGDLDESEYLKMVKDGDHVLCRTTAPLVSGCLRMIRNGRLATVKGKEIGDGIMELVDTVAKAPWQPIEQFKINLDTYYMNRVDRLTKMDKEYELAELTDTVEAIKAIMEPCAKVSDIKFRIDSIFKRDEDTQGIIFCTIHKSKGLETDNTFLIEPDLLPHRKAKTPEQLLQEENLRYVAYTRHKVCFYNVHSSRRRI